MDPNITLFDLLDSLYTASCRAKAGLSRDEEDHRADAIQGLLDLMNWLKEGGFSPTNINISDRDLCTFSVKR